MLRLSKYVPPKRTEQISWKLVWDQCGRSRPTMVGFGPDHAHPTEARPTGNRRPNINRIREMLLFSPRWRGFVSCFLLLETKLLGVVPVHWRGPWRFTKHPSTSRSCRMVSGRTRKLLTSEGGNAAVWSLHTDGMGYSRRCAGLPCNWSLDGGGLGMRFVYIASRQLLSEGATRLEQPMWRCPPHLHHEDSRAVPLW